MCCDVSRGTTSPSPLTAPTPTKHGPMHTGSVPDELCLSRSTGLSLSYSVSRRPWRTAYGERPREHLRTLCEFTVASAKGNRPVKKLLSSKEEKEDLCRALDISKRMTEIENAKKNWVEMSAPIERWIKENGKGFRYAVAPSGDGTRASEPPFVTARRCRRRREKKRCGSTRCVDRGVRWSEGEWSEVFRQLEKEQKTKTVLSERKGCVLLRSFCSSYLSPPLFSQYHARVDCFTADLFLNQSLLTSYLRQMITYAPHPLRLRSVCSSLKARLDSISPSSILLSRSADICSKIRKNRTTDNREKDRRAHTTRVCVHFCRCYLIRWFRSALFIAAILCTLVARTQACPAGHVPNAGNTACVWNCSKPGHFLDLRVRQCSPCEPGTFDPLG